MSSFSYISIFVWTRLSVDFIVYVSKEKKERYSYWYSMELTHLLGGEEEGVLIAK